MNNIREMGLLRVRQAFFSAEEGRMRKKPDDQVLRWKKVLSTRLRKCPSCVNEDCFVYENVYGEYRNDRYSHKRVYKMGC